MKVITLLRDSALALHESFMHALVASVRDGNEAAVEKMMRGSVESRSDGATIGVINISGVITPASYYGDVSVEAISFMLSSMVEDDSVAAVVLNIDSPGGVVYGISDLAAEITAAKAKKPIIAYTSGLMASAAYWIGSSATKVFASVGSQIGSIGVYNMHMDWSRYLSNLGIEVTIVKAGDNKAAEGPYAPLSEDAKANMQERVNDYYDQFVSAVAKARGVTVAAVNKNYGQGTVFNARKAHELGMIDGVASFSSVLGAVSKMVSSKSKASVRALQASAGGQSDDVSTTVDSLTVDASASVASLGATSMASQHLSAENVPIPAAAAAAGGNMDEKEKAAFREKQLRAMARTHGKDMTWLDNAVESGKSVESIQEELLAEYAASSAATRVSSVGSGTGAGASNIVVGEDRETKKPFASFGDFLGAVMSHTIPGKVADKRLMPEAAAQGMNQGILSEGGFAVPPQWSAKIWDGLNDSPDNLLGKTDQYNVDGDYLEMPRNPETSRATGSRYGGVQGYWIAEADQITKSKPKLGRLRLEPQQLAVLVYLTEKLMRNSGVALEQYVTRAATDEIMFLTGDAIVNGSGAGKPLGLLNAPCAVTVNKETSQPAATIQQENVSKMWARLHPRARRNAVWLHNVDVEPQFDFLNTVVKNVAGTENVGGYANKVWDAEKRTLKGRPVIACEYCQTLGTKGDLILWAPDYYATGVRSAGLMSDVSMHVRFEYAEQAFRFMYDVDGQPWLESAITPFKGSNTLSTIVLLQTR